MSGSVAERPADVVIVGGGVIGAACAEALSREGLGVVLLERHGLAAGASSACQSGIGLGPFMEDYDLRLHLGGIAAYGEMAAGGLDVDYHRCGGLLVGQPDEDARIKARLDQLRCMGVACEWLDQAALRAAEPRLSPALSGAALFEDVGQASPMRVVVELLGRASRCGARIHPGTELTGIELTRGRVTAALTGRGRIAAGRIVIATGAWSREVGRLAGLQVPVWPLKGHVLVTEPAAGTLRHYVSDSGYEGTVEAMRDTEVGPDGPRPAPPQVAAVVQNLPYGQLLIGSSREFAGFDREVSRDRVAQIGRQACRLVPSLAQMRIIRTYTGFRPWTPDGRPLIGPSRQAEGIHFATGHGGDGNTLALLTGRLLADLMTGRPPPIDAGPLSPDRFVSAGGSG